MVFGDDVSPESGFPLAAAPLFGRTEGPQKSRFPEKGDKQKVWSSLALPQYMCKNNRRRSKRVRAPISTFACCRSDYASWVTFDSANRGNG